MTEVVWITGCTRGLGRAMTDVFVSLGWRVAGCGRSAEIIGDMADECKDDGCLFVPVDLSRPGEVERFCSEALLRTGPPDLLLNNAGLINRRARLWEIDEEEFSKIVDVNVKGVASMIRHTLPAMIRRGSGVVVNFSSGWGRSAAPGVAPYCATKWAIEGMTAALAQELPPPLAAVALNPGIIDTEMLRTCFGSDAASYPSPAEWAATAVPFLCQLDHRHNGQAMTAP